MGEPKIWVNLIRFYLLRERLGRVRLGLGALFGCLFRILHYKPEISLSGGLIRFIVFKARNRNIDDSHRIPALYGLHVCRDQRNGQSIPSPCWKG